MNLSVRVEIQRQGYTEFGTLGRLRVFARDREGHEELTFTCLTAENPDRGNLPRVSCIPEGDYRLTLSIYHRGGYPAFQIYTAAGDEIPGRSLVKIHRGNTDLDVQGCIVLGRAPVVVKGHWGVGRSGGPEGGFTRFMETMRGIDACALEIYFRKG